MFNGSEHHNEDGFKALEKVGATNNDRTNYFEGAPTTALDQALWLDSDRMGWLIWVLVRDREVVEPKLKGLGLELRVIDADAKAVRQQELYEPA